MRTLLREPLVHFLLIGAALFALARFTGSPAAQGPTHIVVTAQTIDGLVQGWQRTWGRPPSPQELDGLIEDHVREEVLYREALALGLDRDDTIVRRRLRQKVEFLFEDLAEQREPTEAELQAYLAAHAETFRIEPRFSFRHVYLSAQRGETLRADAERMLALLRKAGATGGTDVGDSFQLGRDFAALGASDVERIFGESFLPALSSLEIGTWQGPIASGYGLHLVLLGERVAARDPTLAEVRDAVRRDWQQAHRREANERFYRDLSERYTVTVERAAAPTP